MKLKPAQIIAEKILNDLSPFAKKYKGKPRIKIAGSVRRKKANVKDIEIVMVRDTLKLLYFKDYFDPLYTIKGNLLGKYIRFVMPPKPIHIDLFMCNLDNWGYILPIRTGSADFSHHVLAKGWVKKGYGGSGGYLYKGARGEKNKIQLYEERELFELIDLPYVEPTLREV